MRPFGIVYLVADTLTGKKYVGQTRQVLEVRWQQHVGANYTLPPQSALDKAIRATGADLFTIEQIDEATNQLDLDDREAYWIRFHWTANPERGYNSLEARTANPAFAKNAPKVELSSATRARFRNRRKQVELKPVEHPTVLRWHSLPAHMRRDSSA